MIETISSFFITQRNLNAPPPTPTTSDARTISQNIHKIILKLYGNFLNPEGTAVDYKGLETSPEFREFEEATTQLHGISLDGLSEIERKIFFINLYNTGLIHAYVKFGPPGNFLARLKFYAEVGYTVGGYFYSLNDIENGILRNNSPNAIGGFSPFGAKDPRRQYMVPLDPRVHFALVCGAKSCPPIRVFNPENCENALHLAAKSFCQGSVYVLNPHTIVVSPIFKWYAADFGKEPKKILEFILRFVEDKEIERIKNLSYFSIKYSNYDWSINSNL